MALSGMIDFARTVGARGAWTWAREAQEFMRKDINTPCAESATLALTAIGLELKATIDRFRERVQNVE